jgi:hypothetical protein
MHHNWVDIFQTLWLIVLTVMVFRGIRDLP